MARTKSIQSDIIKVSGVTLSFPHLFEKNDDGKYTTQVFLDRNNKSHMATAKLIEKECKKTFKLAGYDMDDYVSRINKPDKRRLKKQPELKGKLYFNCGNKQRPIVLDSDNSEDLADQDAVIYGGVVATLLINVFSYTHPKQGDGVALSLNCVKKIRDGERLGSGGMNVDDAKEMLEGEGDKASKKGKGKGKGKGKDKAGKKPTGKDKAGKGKKGKSKKK